MSQSTPTPTDPREDIYNTYASMFGGMDLVVPLDVARNIIDGLTSELATAREERDAAVAKASNLFDGSVVLGADNETLQAELEAARKERDERKADLKMFMEMHDTALAAKDAAEKIVTEAQSFLTVALTEQIAQAEHWVNHYSTDPLGKSDRAHWDGKARAFTACLDLITSALTPAPTQEPPAGGVTISTESNQP